MADDRALTPREAMEREKARLFEEAQAIDRKLAEIEQLERKAAEYGYVLAAAPNQSNTTIAEVPKDEHQAFDGSVAGLIALYKTDENSGYSKLRYRTREHYNFLMRRLDHDMGLEFIRDIDLDRIKRAHDKWLEGGHISIAHALVGMLRGMAAFGATVHKDKECRELKFTISEGKFQRAKSQSERLTPANIRAIRAQAHIMEMPSIALAQAIQFECGLGQRDVIGEWVPDSEPGESDIHDNGLKWLRGIRWSKIDKDHVLRHVTSRNERALEFRLSDCPMVMEELVRQFGGKLLPDGPLIVREETELPWDAWHFRVAWRKIAQACGISNKVKNMDSRSIRKLTGTRSQQLNGHAMAGEFELPDGAHRAGEFA